MSLQTKIMIEKRIGFVGLGNMGAPMAANLSKGVNKLICYDSAGTTKRAPQNSIHASSIAEVAEYSEILFLCLPDGPTVNKVVKDIISTQSNHIKSIVDNTTSGTREAFCTHEILKQSDIEYVDAPVSGGASGARAGTLTMMVAAPKHLYVALEPLLLLMAKNARHVGEQPGQGMAMKLLNNFLSGMAMAATSEAIAFGAEQGLDMQRIIDIVSVSTGTNSAITDKFPNRITNNRYDSGFSTKLMAKDLTLYVNTCKELGAPHTLSEMLLDKVWKRMLQDKPDSDFTEIYPFTKDQAG